MSEDEEFDIPERKPVDEVPAWLRTANEKTQGYGVNPENARRMIAGAGGEKKPQAVEEPTEEDFAAVQKMLEGKGVGENIAGLWQRFMDYYWSTKQRNAGASQGAKPDPSKQPAYTPEQIEAYERDQERQALMKRDYQKRNIENGNWKKFAGAEAFAHQGDDLGIEGDRQ